MAAYGGTYNIRYGDCANKNHFLRSLQLTGGGPPVPEPSETDWQVYEAYGKSSDKFNGIPSPKESPLMKPQKKVRCVTIRSHSIVCAVRTYCSCRFVVKLQHLGEFESGNVTNAPGANQSKASQCSEEAGA